jgi:hypothetical protein
MKKPEIIEKLEKELIGLLEADEKPDISANQVARLLNIDVSKFRNMVYSGNVPFAIGENGGKHGRGFCRVSKLALWNWINGASK